MEQLNAILRAQMRIIPGAKITQRGDVMRFVNSRPDSIDLKPMFLEYLGRVRTFHAWFQRELESESLVALRDYDHIMQEKDNYNQRMWWKAMLGNWKNWKSPPNPHDHLLRLLPRGGAGTSVCDCVVDQPVLHRLRHVSADAHRTIPL